MRAGDFIAVCEIIALIAVIILSLALFSKQARQIAILREAAAYAYQLAGAVGAGVEALDNLSAALHDDLPPHPWPVACSGQIAALRAALEAETNVIERLESRITVLEKAR